MKKNMVHWLVGCCLACLSGLVSAEGVYYFSVLNQRSPTLTAQYWNPILAHVSRRSGVELKLIMGKTAAETTALTLRGEAQFAYTNHLFTVDRAKLGWKVIALPSTDGIRGQLVTTEGSAINKLEDLEGQMVAFPSAEAFAGFKLPMDALMRKGIKVTPSFAGNQEGAMGQLKAGRTMAAGVNEDVMQAYSRREGFRYRVLWSSDTFLDLPVMAGPNVPIEVVKRVQQALLGMQSDPDGKRILEESAAALKLPASVGFIAASDRDYENYRAFYRNTVLKD